MVRIFFPVRFNVTEHCEHILKKPTLFRPSRANYPWKRQRPHRQWKSWRWQYYRVRNIVLAAALGGIAAQYVIQNGLPTFETFTSSSPYAAVASIGQPFGLCYGGYQANCVIDGDTIEYMGHRTRMVDYDTPEISEAKCASEAALGHRAKVRLLEILNSGTVDVRAIGGRDEDQYGRKLRLVTVDGRSVGSILAVEGLARVGERYRRAWCN